MAIGGTVNNMTIHKRTRLTPIQRHELYDDYHTLNNEMHHITFSATIQGTAYAATCMNTFLTIYYTLKARVSQLFHSLKLKDREHPKGRKSALTNSEAVTCAILKQKQNIATKKSLWEIMEPPLSYQKFVDSLNPYPYRATQSAHAG
ncbi:MAG: hypothetical protein Q8Q94_00265 [bacterium]|nr:hypothetical protein [bacterium]